MANILDFEMTLIEWMKNNGLLIHSINGVDYCTKLMN